MPLSTPREQHFINTQHLSTLYALINVLSVNKVLFRGCWTRRPFGTCYFRVWYMAKSTWFPSLPGYPIAHYRFYDCIVLICPAALAGSWLAEVPGLARCHAGPLWVWSLAASCPQRDPRQSGSYLRHWCGLPWNARRVTVLLLSLTRSTCRDTIVDQVEGIPWVHRWQYPNIAMSHLIDRF